MSEIRAKKNDEIINWLNSNDTTESELSHDELTCSSLDIDSCSSIVESSSSSSSCSESGEEFALGERVTNTQMYECDNDLASIPAITFNNVNISNSTNVYLGNIYNVSGNLNINVINNSEQQLYGENMLCATVGQQKKSIINRPACLIYPRYRWLAMDPLGECSRVQEPVDIVVIAQTTTASSTEQARNIGIIRDFQTLNVETQGFNDIIYNFLIGCDGIVYEGRGWGVEGDHTDGYNNKSIGIAFVGNFKCNLPTERALKACQHLFIRGVTEGHLSKDYKIMTQTQCLSNENSNNILYKELKKWEHFNDVQYDDEH